jgi:uncharacterized YccA/Bax inhibitor family protein
MFGVRSRNPMLRSEALERTGGYAGGAVMSIDGFVNKCGILFAVLVFTFSWAWQQTLAQLNGWLWAAVFAGFILALVTSFAPQHARITAPLYAAAEGVVLGAISRVYDAQFQGIVFQAVLLTFGVLGVMLFLYRTRIVRPTEKMRMILTSAVGAIALVYLIQIVMGFFGAGIPLIFGSGPVGIGFSLLVVGIAAFTLILDFEFIENAAGRAPKQLEWYSAFALMVTLIWMYLEILRLLSKMQSRR